MRLMKGIALPIAVLLLVCGFFRQEAKASHFKGVEIYYDYLGSPSPGVYDYRFYLILYADCEGSAQLISGSDTSGFELEAVGACGAPTVISPWRSVPVQVPNTNPPQFYTNDTLWGNNPGVPDIQDITPYCNPNIENQCDPGAPNDALPGVSKFIWTVDYRFSGNLCTEYIARFDRCCRNDEINAQIPAAANDDACLETTMRLPELGNSSPRFTIDTTPFAYQGVVKSFNLGPQDPNGDDMAYSIGPIFGFGTCGQFTAGQYNPGMSPANPIPAVPPLAINPITGAVTFTPTANPGDYATTFEITETRDTSNGGGSPPITLSIVKREIQFTIFPPLNTVINDPTISEFEPDQPRVDSVYIELSDSVCTQADTIQNAFLQGLIEITVELGQTVNAEFWIEDTGFVVFTNGDTAVDSVLASTILPPGMGSAITSAFTFPQEPLVPWIINWTPTATGQYDFILFMENNLCPLPLENNQSIRINVVNPVPIEPPTVNVNCTEVTWDIPPATQNNYEWTFSGDELDNNPNNTNVTPFVHSYTQPGDYPYAITYTRGECEYVQEDTVTISEGVVMANGAGNDLTVCSGTPVEIGSLTEPNQTYSWTPAANLNDPAVANPTFTANVPGPDPDTIVVSVFAEDLPTGCTFEDSINVVVYPIPQAQITTTPPQSAPGVVGVCPGDTVIVEASLAGGGSAFSYLWSTGQDQSADRDSLIGLQNSAAISVRIGDSNGCLSDPASVFAEVTQPPQPQLSVEDEICEGEEATATGFGDADTYAWSTGDTANTITLTQADLSNTLTYTATPLLNGCAGPSEDFTININPNPNVSFSLDPGNDICEGEVLDFTYTGDPVAEYEWNFGPGAVVGVSNLQNPSDIEFQASNSGNPGNDITLVARTAAGCEGSFTDVVNVYPVPTARLGVLDGEICFNEFGDGQQRFRFVNNTRLNGAAPAAMSYEWQFLPDGSPGSLVTTETDDTLPAVNFASDGTKVVTLRAVAGGRCESSASAEVTVLPKPQQPTAFNDTICAGYFAELSARAPNRYTIYWYEPGESRENYFHSGRGYTPPERLNQNLPLQLRNFDSSTGCYSDPSDILAFVHRNPQLRINVSNTQPQIPNATVTFSTTGTPEGAFPYWEWDFGDGNTSKLPQPTHQYLEPGTYNVSLAVQDRNGCVFSAIENKVLTVEELQFIQVPTAFTPNGDNIAGNDEFRVFTKMVEEFEINIYDRYGNVVFSSQDINFRWDGTMNGNGGEPMPEGVYVYRIQATTFNGSELDETGTITLLR